MTGKAALRYRKKSSGNKRETGEIIKVVAVIGHQRGTDFDGRGSDPGVGRVDRTPEETGLGGTCRDVCRELSIPCVSMDIRHGQDAADTHLYAAVGKIDFAWLHPSYWRQIRYNDDARCLSNAPTLAEFLDRMQLVLRNAKSVLTQRGRIAVLIGGYSDQGRYQPLPQLLVERAGREGLWLSCIEIIRLRYGNTSSRKVYRSSFIPGVHDQCLIFEPDVREHDYPRAQP